MLTRTRSDTRPLWRVALPAIVVQAGAGGAMLSITLLRPSVLTLLGGHALVLHDPLGLMGDRLLARLHRALAEGEPGLASGARWVAVQGPLSRTWEVAECLDDRPRWGSGTRRWPPRASRPTPAPRRVAEVGDPRVLPSTARSAETARRDGLAPDAPRVLLLSECDRPDALTPHAAARLLLRAVQHEWSVFAVTRQGPARAGVVAAGAEAPTLPAWRTHLVCRSGVLEPVRTPPARA